MDWAAVQQGPAFGFTIVGLIIVFGPLVAERLRLPGLLGLLTFGALIGPNMLDVLPRFAGLQAVGSIGVLYLIFLAGLQLDLETFVRYRVISAGFGLLTAVIPMAFGTAAALLLDIDLGPGSRPSEQVTADLVAAGRRVLLVSALGEASRIRSALVAGALGYVPKRAGGETLHAAVESALRGEVHVSPDLAAVMMAADDTPQLSTQESTALRLYASGLKLESVARRMNVSPSTVREYLARVRRKYAGVGREVRTKTDMYAAAIKDGFIEPRD